MATQMSSVNNGNVLGLIIKLLFWQGIGYEPPHPDVQFYLRYLHPSVASLYARHPALRALHKALPALIIGYLGLRTLFLGPMTIYKDWRDKSIVLENVYLVALCVMSLIGILTLYCQRREHWLLTTELIEICREENLDNDRQKWILKRNMKMCMIVTRLAHFCVVLGIALVAPLMSAVYLLPRRLLWARGWYPYDLQSFPAYEITLFTETIFLILITLIDNTLISYVLTSFSLLTVHHEIMRNKFDSIQQKSMATLKEKRIVDKMRTQIKTFRRQRKTVSIRRVNLVSLNKNCGNQCGTMMAKRMMNDKVAAKKVNHNFQQWIVASRLVNNCVMLATLVKYVKQHVALTRLTNSLRSKITAYLMGIVILNICCLATTCVLLKKADDIGVVDFIMIVFTLELAILFYTHSRCAGIMASENELIMEAMYTSDWFQATSEYKKAMLIVMARACNRFEIKPPGFEPLSLMNFGQMLSRAYKLLTTIEKLM